MSLSSFVPSSCFHGYPSLCAVHYLSLPPFPSLSLSLCSYLSHFAFISASLPPALSHTLLTPAFISFHFHLSFTFLSPSSLPFHHAVFFFSFLLMESERERKKSFICCPINSAFLITFQSSNPRFHFHWHNLSFTCVLDRVVSSSMLIPGLLLCSSSFRKVLA